MDLIKVYTHMCITESKIKAPICTTNQITE